MLPAPSPCPPGLPPPPALPLGNEVASGGDSSLLCVATGRSPCASRDEGSPTRARSHWSPGWGTAPVSVDGCVDKERTTPGRTRGHYSATKRKATLPFPAMWMDLKGIGPSEINQTHEEKTTWSHLDVKGKTVRHVEAEGRWGRGPGEPRRSWCQEQSHRGAGRASPR